MAKFKRCGRPCKFRAPDTAANGCDYLSITGHSRGCPPCDECTRFERGERSQVIMDEWKVPKVLEVETTDVDLYTLQQVRKHRQFLAKNHR